ncbi:MAG TPA: MFS transporter, partial [Bacillota bacterium]
MSNVGRRVAERPREDTVTGSMPESTIHLTRRPWVLAALIVGMFMAAIEATVIATAVPSIVGDLQGFHLFAWLFSSFTLAQAVTTPLFGRLSDIIGRKPVYTAGAGLFLLGSMLCGLSRSMLQLILCRGLQGLGAGAIFPIAMTIVGDIYSPVERARIQGYLSSVWGISSVVGPALGGVLVSTLGWPWVFFVNLPIGVLSVAMLLAFHREPPRRRGARLDLIGAALLVVAVTSLIVMLTQRGTLDLTAGPGAVLVALTVGGLVSFVYWERRAPEPLLPLRLITRPLIAAANAGALLAGVLVIALSSL